MFKICVNELVVHYVYKNFVSARKCDIEQGRKIHRL